MITQYIPDIIGEVVEAANEALPFDIYYDYETYKGVLKNLSIKDGGITTKGKKFPLVWLIIDFKENMGESLGSYAELPDLMMLIAMGSDMNFTMQQRRDKNYIPYLYPIYAELIHQFSKSRRFNNPREALIQHTKIDLPKWGTPDGHVLNECVDVLMIQNLKLSVKRLIC